MKKVNVSTYIESFAEHFFEKNKADILAYIQRKVNCCYYRISDQRKEQYLNELPVKVANCSDSLVIFQAHKAVLYAAGLSLLERILDRESSFLDIRS